MAYARDEFSDLDETGVVIPQEVKVDEACQLFALKGDESFAHNLQNKEFDLKYGWNREVRRTARVDVPLAISAHDEEEERLQSERMEFFKNQNRLTEEDAEFARKFQNEELLGKDTERLRQEIEDQVLAQRLQEAEQRQQQQPHHQHDDDDNGRSIEGATSRPIGGTVIQMSSFEGFQAPNNISPEEQKTLLLLQDEELAMALQEHERLKARRETERNFVILQRRQPQSLNADEQRAIIMENTDHVLAMRQPPPAYDGLVLLRRQTSEQVTPRADPQTPLIVRGMSVPYPVSQPNQGLQKMSSSDLSPPPPSLHSPSYGVATPSRLAPVAPNIRPLPMVPPSNESGDVNEGYLTPNQMQLSSSIENNNNIYENIGVTTRVMTPMTSNGQNELLFSNSPAGATGANGNLPYLRMTDDASILTNRNNELKDRELQQSTQNKSKKGRGGGGGGGDGRRNSNNNSFEQQQQQPRDGRRRSSNNCKQQ